MQRALTRRRIGALRECLKTTRRPEVPGIPIRRESACLASSREARSEKGALNSEALAEDTGRRSVYNSAMVESPQIDGPDAEERQAPAEVEEAPQPGTPASTELVFEGLATGKEPWRGSGCSSRLPLYGCLFGLVLLIGILFIGTSMMRRTVWVNLEKARRAVVQSLPRDLPAAERQRTIDNLERLRATLESSKDPYSDMGGFVKRVREVLQDGRFTVEEVGGLNVFIERMIDESGGPPQQVEFRISDFGFRIYRLSDELTPGRNSKLKTQNSKLV